MAGAEVRWRIVVHIGSGQPELRAALAELPSRARAERLRQLALLGLYNLRCGSTAAMIPPAAQVAETQTGLSERRERLLRSLCAGQE
jgi:ferric-dicitrate binding protein FerR (iron transport regulator)